MAQITRQPDNADVIIIDAASMLAYQSNAGVNQSFGTASPIPAGGHSGAPIEALPVNNENYSGDTNITDGTSPGVTGKVWFNPSTENYIVWVLMYRRGSGTAQVRVGIDGVLSHIPSSNAAVNAWAWDSDNTAGAFGAVANEIKAISLWKRQQNVLIDRVVLVREGATLNGTSITPTNHPSVFAGPATELIEEPTSVGGAGSVKLIEQEGGDLVLINSLAAGALDNLVIGSLTQVMNTFEEKVGIADNGVPFNQFSVDAQLSWRTYDYSLPVPWLTYQQTIPPDAAAALPALVPGENITAGATIAYDSAADLTGLNVSAYCLRIDGTDLPGDIVLTDAANGLFTHLFPEDKAGIFLADGLVVELAAKSGPAITTGFANLRGRGSLISPVNVTHSETYPESFYTEDGETFYTDQIEVHGDGNYSVLLNENWEGPFALANVNLTVQKLTDYSGEADQATFSHANVTVYPADSAKLENGCVVGKMPGSQLFIWDNAALTGAIRAAGVRLKGALANNNASPILGDSQSGWSLAPLHGAGNTLTLTALGPAAEKIGAIGVTLDAPLPDPADLYVEWRFGPSGSEWRVMHGSETVIPDLAVVPSGWMYDTYFPEEVQDLVPDRGGAYGHNESPNPACIASQGVSGIASNPSIVSQSLLSVRHGDAIAIDWDLPNSELAWTVTDQQGNTRAQTAVATDADTNTIAALDLDGLWYGSNNLTLDDGAGNSVTLNHLPPVGWVAQTLGVTLQPSGITAGFSPLCQVIHKALSNGGRTVTMNASGVFTFVGGGWSDYVETQHNSGDAWGAVARQYPYRDPDYLESVSNLPPLVVAPGTAISIDLSEYLNETILLPDDENGPTGTLSIALLGDSGLALTNSHFITGNAPGSFGEYVATVQVTDPDGTVFEASMPLSVEFSGESKNVLGGSIAMILIIEDGEPVFRNVDN